MTCTGRHWFAYPRMVGSSAPTCTRYGCHAPNPNYRPDDDPKRGTCEQRGCFETATVKIHHEGVGTSRLCTGHADVHEPDWRARGWPITRTPL